MCVNVKMERIEELNRLCGSAIEGILQGRLDPFNMDEYEEALKGLAEDFGATLEEIRFLVTIRLHCWALFHEINDVGELTIMSDLIRSLAEEREDQIIHDRTAGVQS